jgi:hypothetical protein
MKASGLHHRPHQMVQPAVDANGVVQHRGIEDLVDGFGDEVRPEVRAAQLLQGKGRWSVLPNSGRQCNYGLPDFP